MNTLPLHLGPFVLSISKGLLKIIINPFNGFFTNGLYYRHTDSLYNENKHWDKLDKPGLDDNSLLQGKMNIKRVVSSIVGF